MVRWAALSFAVVALLGLEGCKTDNPPTVDSAPPAGKASSPPSEEAPTPETVAWADAVVTGALAAEKSARDAGKDETAVQAAIEAGVVSAIQTRIAEGRSTGQVTAGIRLAAASPRNTPATAMALKHVLDQLSLFPSTPTGSGYCPGCKS